MSLADWGLVAFVVVQVANVLGLLTDGVLYETGALTITDRVLICPLLGAPILALQVVALVGLALHFYAE